MLTIYGSELSGPANKVRFVANFIGLEYTYRPVDLRNGEHKQEWFLKINPVGKIPAMDDGGFCMFESGAICKYLCEKAKSSLYPQDLKTRALIEQWNDFSNLHIGVNMSKLTFNRVFAPRRGWPVSEESIADGTKFLAQYLPIIETQLAKNNYLAGNQISLADMTLLAALDPAEMSQVDLSVYPKLSAWRKSLQQQSFYTKCHKEYGESLPDRQAGLKATAGK